MFKFINCSRFVTLNWPLSPPSVYFNLFFFKNSRLILFTTGPIRFYSFRRSISLLNFLPFVPMFPANLALYLLLSHLCLYIFFICIHSLYVQVQLYNRKINIGERDLFERGLKFEAADDNEQAITCYVRAGECILLWK